MIILLDHSLWRKSALRLNWVASSPGESSGGSWMVSRQAHEAHPARSAGFQWSLTAYASAFGPLRGEVRCV